jgi:hypothetical protein
MINSVYLFFYFYFFIILAIVISWDMNLENTHAEISQYQIFAYKESPTELPRSSAWQEIGKVDALPLPMTSSLTNVNIIMITFENNFILIKIVLDCSW